VIASAALAHRGIQMGVVVIGVALAAAVLASALETVVLPRDGFTRIARVTFAVVDRLLVRRWRNAERTASMRGMYAPVALATLPLVWMILIIVAFTGIFWGIGSGTWQRSMEISGSSVTTLGFAAPTGAGKSWIAFVEAVIGLGLVALLISYLPTIYAAHHDREKGIRTLRPFAGTPASSEQMLTNFRRFQAISNDATWETASQWLLELDQTHCSFPALSYFPETSPTQSWVASVGALLDTAALIVSTSETPLSQADLGENQGPLLVLAHGIPSIVRIGRAIGLPIDPPATLIDLLASGADGKPTEAISISQEEFTGVVDRCSRQANIPRPDMDVAWQRFQALRSTYDHALRGLAGLTIAAPAPWTTDRPAKVGRPRLVTNRPLRADWSLPAITD